MPSRAARRGRAAARINLSSLIFMKYVCDSFALRLAAMNMAIRGIDFNFGKEPANSFTNDQHPDLRADYVMALPSAAARSHPRSHTTDRPAGRINPPSKSRNGGTVTTEENGRNSMNKDSLENCAKQREQRLFAASV